MTMVLGLFLQQLSFVALGEWQPGSANRRPRLCSMSQLPQNVTPVGTLVLVCGLPGSGKTTFAKKLEADRNAIRMCPDDWIEAVVRNPNDALEKDRLRTVIENLQWDLTRQYLCKGLTVILENGFWAEEERSQYAMGALELGARIELYAMDSSDIDELWRRIELRNLSLRSSTWVMKREDHEPKWIGYEAPSPEEIAFYDDGRVI